MGIMEEIKEHLKSGLTVKEIKELGFKAPSIYKVKNQLKNKEPEVNKKSEVIEESEPFQEVKEDQETPKTILETDNTEPDNTITDSTDILDNQEEKEESINENLSGDDDKPFREFNEVDINRNHVNIDTSLSIPKEQTKSNIPEIGKIGVAELITQVYSLIGISTDHEHWEVSPKEQKVLKHLCKIPALEAVLHKFGLYGCVISLITMTLKRIKIEMQLRKLPNKEEDQGIIPEPIIRADSPTNVMGLFEK